MKTEMNENFQKMLLEMLVNYKADPKLVIESAYLQGKVDAADEIKRSLEKKAGIKKV